MLPITDDTVLMLAYAQGDAAAFEQLYLRHKQGLYGFIQRQSPRTAWVDDLFQDSWLAVVKARADYSPTAAFRTWLYGIARNKLIDRIRLHEPALLGDFVSEEAGDPYERFAAPARSDPARILLDKRTGMALDAALRGLPAVQREVFLLREQAEMSLEDIASLVGVPMETAKSRLRYAMAKLKLALAGELP
ncbi:RNA polymerase sigma factor [Chitinimonas arctica]|uniref:RNA polymerase sigma factor n=1 Tax=Chitinimonas arctica TaxID=2594795 RepID=A0A516SH87_9NEIS|nr:RNA polymerase sigma factor [Chitinimonas arctica]QDQ27398.1 RNA polymerase sigma factor [Chitinimonas arctica]